MIAVRWAVSLPILVAIVLNLPNLNLGYFWDDFYFLTGIGGSRNFLLPDPHTAFYRPIPQAVYFALLRLIDPTHGFVGHVLNLAILCGALALLVLLVSRLCGPRAGFISGLVFASYGCVPSLVAWISASQDLFAITLVLAAFYLRDRGRIVLPIACATAALLCKEPAIAAFPVLVLWDRIRGRPPSRERAQLAAYGAIAVSWALLHPGIRMLASRGFQSGTTGYVGIEHPERWSLYFARYVLSLFNLPPPGLVWSWWQERVPYGVLALALLIVGLLFLDRWFRPTRESASLSLARVGLIGGLFTVPTLLMPTVLIRHWAPYFACIPSLGLAIFFGPLIARQNRIVAFLVIAALLILGVWYRGVRGGEEPVWTERVLVQASDAVKKVRSRFKEAFPQMPQNATVLASVGSTGTNGILSTMVEGQALKVWYRDPSIRTIPILDAGPPKSGEPQYLVRITPELAVLVIDPYVPRVRPFPPTPPDMAEVVRPIITYARAVAASGDLADAVRISEGLARRDPRPGYLPYYRRMSAAFLLSAGRNDEAQQILATTQAFSVEQSRQFVWKILSEPSSSETVDLATFEAFGLSRNDPSTLGWLMDEFKKSGAIEQAAWIALRLREADPSDSRSEEVIRSAALNGIKPSRIPSRSTN